MAHELLTGKKYPGIAAATIIGPLSGGGGMPVKMTATAGVTQPRSVTPIASTHELPLGIAYAKANPSSDRYPAAVTVHGEGNTVKVVAAASIGVGAEVAIASTNGALGPITGASGAVRNSLGLSETPAAAGEVFSLYVRPRQLSGLA